MLQQWFTSQHQDGQRDGAPDPEAIIDVLLEVSRECPGSRIASLLLSRFYEANGQPEQALQEIERLLQLLPEEEQVLSLAAALNEKHGDMSRAGGYRIQLWRQQRENAKRLSACLNTLRQAGRADEAVALLMEGVQQESWQYDPAIVETLQAEAQQLFMITRQYSEAVDLFERWCLPALTADSSEPNFAQSLLEKLVWALTEAGYYQRAIQYTQTLYQQYPKSSVKSALWLVRTLNIRFQFDQSRFLLEELLRLRPEELSLRLQLYLTMIEQGHKDESIRRALEWVDEEPADDKRQKLVTFLWSRLGNYEKTVSHLRSLLAEEPGDEDLQLRLFEMLVTAGDFEQAAQLLSGRQTEAKDSAEWFDAQIKLDIARGDCQSALARVDEFVREGDSIAGDQVKVQILEACGKMDEAVKTQAEIIARNTQPGQDAESLLRYSVLLDKMGRKNEALEQLEELLIKIPQDGGIKNNLGYLLVESHRRKDRAYQLLRESLNSDPQSGPTLDSLGWFYYKEGKFQPALEYIYQAAAIIPAPDPEMLDHLGDTVYRLGRNEDAGRYWQRALEELQRRIKLQRYLQDAKLRIEGKLQQLEQGSVVDTAPLFEEKPALENLD